MAKKRSALDYADRDIREEILVRQRRDMWTPEQLDSLAKHFRLAAGTALLDAGCGYGYSLRTFGPRCMPGGRLVGIDRDETLLETATRMVGEAGLDAELLVGDILEMPFDDGTFDVVMAQIVLCHLPEPQRALDEMIRVAKPGGCIAVFDNALGGVHWGWSSTEGRSLDDMVTRAEHELFARFGRPMLGRGDWSVGLHVPSWMEARGLVDVDARVNERVQWMAPPYRSPAQRNAVRHARERIEEDGFDRMHQQNTRDEMRAAGADEATIEAAITAEQERMQAFREAVAAGTAAYSYGGTFWCIWGFKPGG